MMSSQRTDVVDYYKSTSWDYKFFWFTDETLAMHYGWWDQTVHSHDESLLRLNEIVAKKLHIKKSDRVFDAGCGFGGSAFWMARYRGCHVTGLSITPYHINEANRQARKKHLEDRVSFAIGDYTHTGFPSQSFDVIYAIESLCHSQEMEQFYKESMRLLKPGGRLLVADGVMVKKNLNHKEERLMSDFRKCWALGDLWTREDHLKSMKKAGFTSLASEYYTRQSNPSAARIYNFSLLGVSVYTVLYHLGLLSVVRYHNARGARLQWITRQKGLWGHAMWWGGEKAF